MSRKKCSILIVDDEIANLQKLKRTFYLDYEVHEAASGELALAVLKQHEVAVIITDQRMPGMTGVELLRNSLQLRPDAARIILTGYTEVEDLLDAINQGHVHRYVTKPWEPASLREMVGREVEQWTLKRENQRLSLELRKANEELARENVRLKREMEVLGEEESRFVYQSRAVKELLSLLERVVRTDSTVLIQGETGTGKELLARHIHRQSLRSEEAFVAVNCGAVPSELVESSFFGHRKGAFTGAASDRKGFFELADRGTLFLDEIGEAPLDLQVKLLRVLQEGEILPVGAEKSREVDVRIIASTNRDLRGMVEEGKFRQDLFFRLNVFSVHVPPLRARSEDVEVLALHFLEKAAHRLNKELGSLSSAALQWLKKYPWPGNIRELQNEVDRIAILAEAGAQIEDDLLSDRVRQQPGWTGADGGLKEQLAALERELILKALRSNQNNKSRAAEELGITRQTIISKLKRYSKR